MAHAGSENPAHLQLLRRKFKLSCARPLAISVAASWSAFIEPYLKERKTLALCLALVDLNVPPQESDKELLHFLNAAGRKALIIGTKADKLSGNTLRRSLENFSRAAPHARVIPYSARTGQGRNELWQEIRTAIQAT